MEHPSLSRLSVAVLLALGALGGAARAAGSTGTSALQNPTFTFATPGDHDVTLTVCNEAGCTQTTRTVTVLDPTPVIDSALVGSAAVEAGRLIKLTASGHGQPPLGFTWHVVLGDSIATGQLVATLSGTSAWWDTAGMAPGIYLLQLDLANGPGTVASSLPFPVIVLPETGASFFTVTPCRLFDSRTPAGGGTLATGATRGIDVAVAACGIPIGAKAISANVTAVGPSGQGHVTIYPGNYPRPATSTLNFGIGQTRANGVVLPLASDGSGTLAADAVLTGSGTVHLLIDVNGYFQ